MRTRRYWFNLLRVSVAALLFVVPLIPFLLGVVVITGLTHPACIRGGNPASFGLVYEEVRFATSRDLSLTGYFMPGVNGATVVIPPAYGNGRGGGLQDAALLNRAGFNVMTFDSPVCAGAGRHSLGYKEVQDVEAAVRYLATRADADPARIGLHGFSSAGATSLMAAARLPAVQAVSAEGGYHDYGALLAPDDAGIYLPGLFTLGASLAYRAITGEDIGRLSPIDAIAGIGPRPVLLIYGSREVSLPGARQMAARAQAAGVEVELWVVEGAGHGDYYAVAGAEFARRLVEFHSAALLPGGS